MGKLSPMPQIVLPQNSLKNWGSLWLGTTGSITKASAKQNGQPSVKKANRFDKKQGMDFGYIFDEAFGLALANMLGNKTAKPFSNSLLPPAPDVVEVGTTRVVGGIRPQNYDAAYRPDGPRIVYDSKTLNDEKSIGKNWQNMVNDLATEASTVHTRFPYCVVAFIIALPRPALKKNQETAIIRTLDRLGSRENELDQHHLAEAISLVIWDPSSGQIDPNFPPSDTRLRIENMHERIYAAYSDRYRSLPPHND
ncbi:hypothetical protein [Qipengyuania flava]|uniref:hypothetical protein n=1 Tax=Qipengyuania flava TaxID=192812 RepID=UPI001C62FA02|nr:hypothetical protein [Qipengyuania flava]QYJ06267.1 hypothetical protein KUV82_09250 [Qipengyuania flava]